MRTKDVTPAEAKLVWESLAAVGVVSSVMVASAFTAAGRPVDPTTIQRWRRRGWEAPQLPSSADLLRQSMDIAAPLITGDPETRIADLVPEMADCGKVEFIPPTVEVLTHLDVLRAMSADQLLTEAAKAHLIAWSALMGVIAANPTKYLDRSIEGVAELFKAGATGQRAPVDCLTGALTLRERTMKLVEDKPPGDTVPSQTIDSDPMARELAHFARHGNLAIVK